ncbi:MAG: sensor histidine kinase [Chloroflexota bacterium]
MPDQSFDTFLFLVFFVYGLAFWGMGLTLALEAERLSTLSDRRILRSLAFFGVIHGTHEWLESYLLQAQVTGIFIPDWLAWVRFGMLIASFACLLTYGVLTFRQPIYHPTIWRKVGLLVVFFYGGAIFTSTFITYKFPEFLQLDLLDVLSRYLLAVPGAILASLALQFQSRLAREKGEKKISVYLGVAGIGFGIYALTQLIVHPLEMIPARFINTETFRAWTGLPIQVVRSLAAIVITISLFRATHQAELERREQLEEAQQQRLRALERVQEELAKKETIRRELLRHVVQAQEEERARIARELHDETAQTLAAFSLDLAAMRALVTEKPECKRLSTRLQTHCKEMSQGLYRLVHDLRPAQLDDLGLVPALQFLLDQNKKNNGIEIQLEVKGPVRRLDSITETVLFRVTQEALMNIIRHAGTKNAWILLHYQKQEIHLAITDSGKGFDPKQTFPPPRGWGIAGMRERVEAVGGQLTIESAPGKGTAVKVVVHLFDIIP